MILSTARTGKGICHALMLAWDLKPFLEKLLNVVVAQNGFVSGIAGQPDFQCLQANTSVHATVTDKTSSVHALAHPRQQC